MTGTARCCGASGPRGPAPDAITFENVEEGNQFESSQKPGWETVREFAGLFLRGDLDAVRPRLDPA